MHHETGFLFIKLFVLTKDLNMELQMCSAGGIMLVKEIAKEAIKIRQESTLKDAAKMMADNGIGCLVVVNDDKLEGIITERDVLKQVSKDIKAMDKPLKEVMSTDLVTVGPDMHIDDAAKLMSEHKIKKLPVFKDGKLLGIITSTDLVANSKDFNDFSLFD
jgi:CBS domain-containing protein